MWHSRRRWRPEVKEERPQDLRSPKRERSRQLEPSPDLCKRAEKQTRSPLPTSTLFLAFALPLFIRPLSLFDATPEESCQHRLHTTAQAHKQVLNSFSSSAAVVPSRSACMRQKLRAAAGWLATAANSISCSALRVPIQYVALYPDQSCRSCVNELVSTQQPKKGGKEGRKQRGGGGEGAALTHRPSFCCFLLRLLGRNCCY